MSVFFDIPIRCFGVETFNVGFGLAGTNLINVNMLFNFVSMSAFYVCVCVCVWYIIIEQEIAELVLYKHSKRPSWLPGMILPNPLPTRKLLTMTSHPSS